MSNQPRIRGEVPFPQAGEGVVLRFTNPDCNHLQKKFGDMWFADAIARANRFDMEFLKECVTVGAKFEGKPKIIAFDSLDCTLVDVAEAVIDGLFLAMHGRTFEDHLSYLDSVRTANKEEDEGNS